VIHLVNAKGEIIDLVQYRNGWSGANGWPNTGPAGYEKANGGSIYLQTASVLSDNPNLANDNGRRWALSVAGVEGAYNQLAQGFVYSPNDVGSPGSIWGVAEVVIPEPASLGLVIGLASFFGLRRRR
jgi:hypothetical protein